MRLVRPVAVLVAAGLVLAACGDDDTDTEAAATTEAAADEPTTTTAAPPTAAPETTTTEAAAPPTGPELTVDPAEVAAATECLEPTGDAGPVLLVHGTGSTPAESFDPSLRATLPELGHEVCTVALPDRSVGDIQLSSEYVVAAVRAIAERTGRPVALVGHSQGVLQVRWAVAFWPDVAEQVSMVVAMAGPNAGSPAADALCAEGCAAALQQMRPGSALLAALDAAWADVVVPTTVIRTVQDEFVPPDSAAAVPGAAVVTVQDVCPDREVSHAGLLADTVAHAALRSALAHDGTPAAPDVAAVDCASVVEPGADLEALLAAGQASLGPVLAAPPVAEEPPLAAYAG